MKLHIIAVNVALLILRIISFLPMPIIALLGRLFGLLGYCVARKRRNIGLINLTLCFPNMSQQERINIIKMHFRYLMTAAFEYSLVFYASASKIKRLVRLKNIENCMQYYKKRPVILLCPHFVGLDMLAVRLSMEFIGCSIYSKQSSHYITSKITQARSRFMKHGKSKLFARQEGMLPVVRYLRQHKEVFFYLPDQDFGERDSLYVPFFAHPYCATIDALPKIARLTNAVVVPVIISKADNHYEAEFMPAWNNYPSSDVTKDVRHMNQCIEQEVIKHIEQYFWLHKRFKTQPNSERGAIYRASL